MNTVQNEFLTTAVAQAGPAPQGEAIPQLYFGKTRRERHEELLAYAIKGGIAQAKIAWEASGGKGRIHMNVLWEMAGAERVLHGVLEGAKGLIHGVTCGAGMPYRIAEICSETRPTRKTMTASMMSSTEELVTWLCVAIVHAA